MMRKPRTDPAPDGIAHTFEAMAGAVIARVRFLVDENGYPNVVVETDKGDFVVTEIGQEGWMRAGLVGEAGFDGR